MEKNSSPAVGEKKVLLIWDGAGRLIYTGDPIPPKSKKDLRERAEMMAEGKSEVVTFDEYKKRNLTLYE